MRLSNLGSATYAFIAICVECTLLQARGEISSPGELIAIAGQNATFMFNSTGKIIAVKFGLYNGTDIPVPKFITVREQTNGKTKPIYGEDLDNPKAAKYKGRVFFVGNLSIGRAWFNITNLTVYDTERYVASIREDGWEDYKPEKPVNLSVKKPIENPGTTSTPQTREARFNKFEVVGEKAFSSLITSQKEKRAFHSAIKKAYENTSGTYEIRILYLRSRRKLWIGGFNIYFTNAKNKTYALSFLLKAMENNQLGGYNITCFEGVRKDSKVKKVGESLWKSPLLITVYVVLALALGLLIFLAIRRCAGFNENN